MGLRGLLHILTLICACASTYGVRPQCDFKLVPLDLKPKGDQKMTAPWRNDGVDAASCISKCKEKHQDNCIIVSFNNKTQTCSSWASLFTGRKGKDPVDEFFFTRINPCTPPFHEYTYGNGKGRACINKKVSKTMGRWECQGFCRDMGGQVYKNLPKTKSRVINNIREAKVWANAGKYDKKTYYHYYDNGVWSGDKWARDQPNREKECTVVDTYHGIGNNNEESVDCWGLYHCTCERFYY